MRLHRDGAETTAALLAAVQEKPDAELAEILAEYETTGFVVKARAIAARAARGKDADNRIIREHYGAPELEAYPKNVVRMLLGGKVEARGGNIEAIVSLPETGDLQISHESDGWRVDHVDYHGDHAGTVNDGLPSRLEALRSVFSYALGCVVTQIARRAPDGAA